MIFSIVHSFYVLVKLIPKTNSATLGTLNVIGMGILFLIIFNFGSRLPPFASDITIMKTESKYYKNGLSVFENLIFDTYIVFCMTFLTLFYLGVTVLK